MPNDVPDYTGVNVYTEAPVPGSPFTVPRDGFTHDLGTISLSAGIESIGLLFSAAADFTGLQVTGSTTGFNYAGNSFIGTGNPITVGLFRTIDPSIDLKVTTVSSAGNATLSAVLLYSGRLVTIDQQQQSAVIIQDSNNHLVGIDLGKDGKYGLKVTQNGAYPAPWQAANSTPIAVGTGTVTVGTVAHLAAAPGVGLRYYLHLVQITANVGADEFILQDTAGTAIAWGRTDSATAQAGLDGDFKGAPLALNVGIDVKNNAGASAAYRGVITASVAA